MSAVARPSAERMVEALRRAIATAVGVSSNRVVRFTIESLTPSRTGPTQLEVLLQEDGEPVDTEREEEFIVEFTCEFALFNDGLSNEEVKSILLNLVSGDSMPFNLFSSVMSSYFQITTLDIKPYFRPYAYYGHSFNALGTGEVMGLSRPLSDLEPDYTSLVAGLILSGIVMPLISALLHWMSLERRMKDELSRGDGGSRRRNEDQDAGTPRPRISGDADENSPPRAIGRAQRMKESSPFAARNAMSPSPPTKTSSSRQKLPAPEAPSGSESVRSAQTGGSRRTSSSGSSQPKGAGKRAMMPPPPAGG